MRQVIVDESFAAFAGPDSPSSPAALVADLPHLVVVNSLSKSHGIAGLRVGYAVASPCAPRSCGAARCGTSTVRRVVLRCPRRRRVRREYENARRRYVRTTRAFLDALDRLPAARAFPSMANFALLELDRQAGDVATELLARHGVYVRDCADKWGLDGDRYLRVAARTETENRRVLTALREVLAEAPPTVARAVPRRSSPAPSSEPRVSRGPVRISRVSVLPHRGYARDRIARETERARRRAHAERVPVERLEIAGPVGRIAREEALGLAYRAAVPGEALGPLFATYWLHGTAVVPEGWAGSRVDLLLDTGGEASNT